MRHEVDTRQDTDYCPDGQKVNTKHDNVIVHDVNTRQGSLDTNTR